MGLSLFKFKNMSKINNNLFIIPENFDKERYEHCWEFKECKDLEEYINKYLNSNIDDIDIEEAAYQYIYDTSNDWFRDNFSSADVENAFIVAALWMRNLLKLKNKN